MQTMIDVDRLGPVRSNLVRAAEFCGSVGDTVDLLGCLQVARQEARSLGMTEGEDLRWFEVAGWVDQALRTLGDQPESMSLRALAWLCICTALERLDAVEVAA